MKLRSLTIIGASVMALSAFGLTACGGGSSGGGSTVTPGGGSGGGGGGGTGDPTWTTGVFEASSNFKSKCAVPRAGTDDQTGSVLYENHWLRSWSNDTYLWYNEITDQNPANYTDPIEYFGELKTTATTASGADRDKFHFTYDSEEWEQLINSGESAGYGAEFMVLDGSPPRDVRVAFSAEGTPAGNANMNRGAKILEIDGEDMISGNNVNVLNAGLFPLDGETHTFKIQAEGEEEPRDVTLTAGIIVMPPVLTTEILTTTTVESQDEKKVGYISFNTFGTHLAEEALYNTITDFSSQGVDELVLDLRYNGGGFLYISSQLGYMIAGESATNGKIYETLVFNDKHTVNNPITGDPLQPTPFYSTTGGFSNLEANLGLPSLNLERIYVLSTDGTCSASESLINSLRGIDVEVVLIGTTTCGKPYGFYGTDNCGTTYFTIQFRGENDKGFGDYSDGFSPFEGAAVAGSPIDGCIVADDFSKQLGDESEAQLAAAMTHINTGACPSDAISLAKSSDLAKASWDRRSDIDAPGSLLSDARARAVYEQKRNRILNFRPDTK